MISEDLSASLERSFAEARELRSETISLEQLLLALLHNPRVADVLLACYVHVGSLHKDLTAIVRNSTRPAEGRAPVKPQASPEYERALQRSIMRVQGTQNGGPSTGLRRAAERILAIFRTPPSRATVNSTDVLVAIFSEKESQAAQALRRHGATRYEVTCFIAHGIKNSDAAEPAAIQDPTPGDVDVVLVNDDFTPMEFVVKVLQDHFMLDLESAAEVMLKIHREGRAVCGRFASDIATSVVARVRAAAREEEHPLRCIVERGQPLDFRSPAA